MQIIISKLIISIIKNLMSAKNLQISKISPHDLWKLFDKI